MYIDETIFGVGDVGLIVTNEKIYFTRGDENINYVVQLSSNTTISYTDRGFWGVQGIKINIHDFVVTQLNDENINYVIDILQNIVNIYNR